MVNYQDGKIYRLFCNKTGKTYYGSTAEKYLSTRKAHHIDAYKKFVRGEGNYVSSFEILQNDDYELVLVEKYPCKDKMELHQRERYYIENNECINLTIPGRTSEEYREDNRDIILNKHKEYYSKNKDEFLRKQKIYRDNNPELIKQQKSKVYVCSCGSELVGWITTKHLNTEKHKEKMSKISNGSINE